MARSGVWNGDKQLKCSCGNTLRWTYLNVTGNSAEGGCSDCGATASY